MGFLSVLLHSMQYTERKPLGSDDGVECSITERPPPPWGGGGLFLHLGIHRRAAGMGHLFDESNISMGCHFYQFVTSMDRQFDRPVHQWVVNVTNGINLVIKFVIMKYMTFSPRYNYNPGIKITICTYLHGQQVYMNRSQFCYEIYDRVRIFNGNI